MQITKEIIQELRDLTTKLNEVQDYINIELPNIKDTHKEDIHKITREGKEQDVKEMFLWEEIFHLGLECEAGQIMANKYPELWTKVKEQEKLVKELEELTLSKIGFNFRQMSLLNLIDLIIGLREI